MLSGDAMINRTGVRFDLSAVRAAVDAAYPLFKGDNVISLTSRPGSETPLRDCVGWLPDGVREHHFSHVNQEFRGTAIEQLLEKLPFPFGRTRLIRMPKKSCLSVHWDMTLRYHYAVRTNPDCYLIWKDDDIGRFYHVPADGWLYEMDARRPHTAINASRQERIHIVICDARDDEGIEGRENHAD